MDVLYTRYAAGPRRYRTPFWSILLAALISLFPLPFLFSLLPIFSSHVHPNEHTITFRNSHRRSSRYDRPKARSLHIFRQRLAGIGRAIAVRLAQDGHNIAINDVPSKLNQLTEVRKELADAHPLQSFVVFAGDVSKEEDVQRMVEVTVDTFGGLDVVNSCR